MKQEDISNMKDLHVLYIEDDMELQECFGAVLEKIFNKLTVASNGQEGLDLLMNKENHFDFIISDIEMPKMSGLDMIKELRKTGSNIPCILTTAHGEFDYFMRANDLGVFRYIQKPLDIQEILEAICDNQRGLEVKKIDL
ncbi:MAG: hypothetical protein CSA86_03320 [Arcobacter sp.]|nr:MAG: hypothetical protein CSA86_03320 [Arcobacter sp.]